MPLSKMTSLLALSLVATTLANTAFADGQVTVGAKLGAVNVDADGFDPAWSGAALIGLPINNNLSIEGEYTRTLVDGDVDVYGYVDNFHWSLWTLGGYGVYRTSGSLYLKGKLGVLYEDTSLFTSDPQFEGSASGNNAEVSFGLGGGYRINKSISLEAEVTRIDSDAIFVGAGVNLHP